MQVSVIIPVYNDQPGIDTCLAALSLQTYPQHNYEVIVIDNGSVPSIQLQEDFAGFARLIVCVVPGSYAARNAGIRAARGDVFAFTDADCIPDRNWISVGTELIVREKGRCVVGGEVALTMLRETDRGRTVSVSCRIYAARKHRKSRIRGNCKPVRNQRSSRGNGFVQ